MLQPKSFCRNHRQSWLRHRSAVVMLSSPLILGSLTPLRLPFERACRCFTKPDLIPGIPDLQQPRRLPHSGDRVLQARTSLKGSLRMRGVIVSELIRERQAKFRDHPISVLLRNWCVTARDHPTLSDVSSVMKVEPVFNPMIEYVRFSKLACTPDTIKPSLALAQHNRF